MFRDRNDAGRRLAVRLRQYQDAANTIVLALPRGGVVTGLEVSVALHLPLDVLITRKLGSPFNAELAMGALCETGYRHLNRDVIEGFGISHQELELETRAQQHEIERRIAVYRRGRPLRDLAGQTVLLVDDGIATGATFYASVAALRKAGVARLVAAVPVAPPDRVADLRAAVDEFVVLETSEEFFGIGQFYQDFTQVSDATVLRCLEDARTHLSGAKGAADVKPHVS